MNASPPLMVRVGKWRCKELFSPGRRTCDLSHARQSNIASMQYHVVRIADVPQAESQLRRQLSRFGQLAPALADALRTLVLICLSEAELVETCHKVFECSLYSSLAVPEVGNEIDLGCDPGVLVQLIVLCTCTPARCWNGELPWQRHTMTS